MILLGGVMVLAPEFVYLRDVFGARMNTIFKFYYQAWMLWSLAAAFSTVIVFTAGRKLAKALVLVVMILGLLYPVLAFPTKTNQFQPVAGYTLDASAYLEQNQPQEAAAIRWLSNAPLGVVAELWADNIGYARLHPFWSADGIGLARASGTMARRLYGSGQP